MIGGAILPSLFRQDPRYIYKGTGSIPSRALYAIANSVICRGDNRRWQPSYSGILGGLAAGGISNLYYPAEQPQRRERHLNQCAYRHWREARCRTWLRSSCVQETHAARLPGSSRKSTQ